MNGHEWSSNAEQGLNSDYKQLLQISSDSHVQSDTLSLVMINQLQYLDWMIFCKILDEKQK